MESTQSNTTFVGHGVHVVSGCPKLNEMTPSASANSTNAPIPNAITERTLAMAEAYKPSKEVPLDFGHGRKSRRLIRKRCDHNELLPGP